MKNFLVKFLLASEDVFNWTTGDGKSYPVDSRFKFIKTICDTLNTLLWPLLIVVATVGSIYAIFLGVNMAKAEDPTKRDEARARLLRTIIGVAIIVVIILLVQLVLIPNMPVWLGTEAVE